MRAIVVGGIAAAALLAAAGPAAAKCGHGSGDPCSDPVSLEVTVYDPSWNPIVIQDDYDGWRMLNVTGVNYGPYGVLDTPPARLGPRYRAIYRFTRGSRAWVLYQDIYPYAAGRPFAYTEPGQNYVEEIGPSVDAQEGWRGSRTLEAILQAYGLPASPPARVKSSITAAGATSRGDGGGSPSGGLLLGAVAFLGLAGLTARWGFRRRSSGDAA